MLSARGELGSAAAATGMQSCSLTSPWLQAVLQEQGCTDRAEAGTGHLRYAGTLCPLAPPVGMGIGMDMSMSMGMGMGIDTGMESH